VNTRRAWDSFA